MVLTLILRGCDLLPDGGPIRLVLDQRGAIIGRSPTVDWTLPDPSRYISSRHCEIRYEGGAYVVQDISTNGTILNGTPLDRPQPLKNGDVLTIGPYEAVATLPESFSSASEETGESTGWGGWDSHVPAGPVGVDPSDWGKSAPQAAISGLGPLSGSMGGALGTPISPPAAVDWAPAVGGAQGPGTPEPPVATAGGSVWDAVTNAGATPAAPASAWSSPTGHGSPGASANDIWGRLEKSNDVDWERAGFGVAVPSPASDRLGFGGGDAWAPPPPPASAEALNPFHTPSPPVQESLLSAGAASPPSSPSIAPSSPTAAGLSSANIAAALGLSADALRQGEAETLAAAGALLRSLIAGIVVMLEARARAKAQMGAQTTSLEFDGNNPLKFARTPEMALAQLLNPPERGFMGSQRAVEDAFLDLQSHQVATLKAMQGALRATLDRFSPKAISERVQSKGLLAQILPGAHDAALWRAYVKEFSGVARGSDEAFMDVFAKEFRKAYEDEAHRSLKRS